jgi:hypothetical protein
MCCCSLLLRFVTCRSYKEWQHDQERGSKPADTAASSGGSAGGSSSSSVGGAVRDLKQEAGDTARSAKEVVQMEGQAAGESSCWSLGPKAASVRITA